MCAIAKEQLHISAVEVRNLRKAFKYMVDEGERLAGPTWPAPLTHGKTSTSSRTDTPPTSVVERCHALALAANDHLVVLETYVESRLSSHSYAEEHCRPHFSLDSLLHTPLERRLQTLCVSLFTFFTGIPGSLVVTIIMLWMSSITAVLMLMYLAYILVIGRPKFPLNKWKWVMRYRIWKYYSDYFPVRLIIPPGIRGQFDATKNYMFCYHPHGVHTFGAIMNFGLDANGCSHMLPGICTHVQSLKINYMVPFWHFLLRFMGVGDASGPSIRGTLRSGPGESVVIVVGGAEEALLSRPRTNDLVLNKRKGFIKIALQEGSPLVPVYAFGETSVYKVAKAGEYRYVRAFMRIVKRFTGIAPPLIIGRGFFCFGFGLLPHRHPIVVVMGAPIEVKTIASPTQEEIDFWHTKYVDALQELYNKYRGIYDLDSSPLRIVK